MNKFLFLFLFAFSIISAQITERYIDSTFTFEQLLTNEVYATVQELNSPYAGESSTHSEELKFHLFGPVQDSLAKRPMLISIHGGAFLTGTKEHDDMLEFCKIFAKRGYITATIQYRIGMNIIDNNSSERAVYRGLQDGRAAIRYFRENAEAYGIDTNHIYLLGSSAGAFVGLHNLYMNEESERPLSTFNSPDLGSLDAVNPELTHGSHPNGLIALWGALKDTTLIKASDKNIPLFLVHGTNDKTVNFDVGPPFGLGFLPSTYGSKAISERLNNLGKSPRTYFVNDEDHEFYGVSNGMWNPSPNAFWDTVVTEVSNFLYDCHKPSADFTFDILSDKVQFNDNSVGANKWHWDFGDSTFSDLQNPEHVYAHGGSFKVSLTVQNNIASWDTISSTIDFSITGVENNILAGNYSLDQNYPNPFNPTTSINYSIPSRETKHALAVKIKVYDVLGNEVVTLVDEYKSPGKYTVKFDAAQLSSETYFYTLTADCFIESKKMIVLK